MQGRLVWRGRVGGRNCCFWGVGLGAGTTVLEGVSVRGRAAVLGGIGLGAGEKYFSLVQ